MEREELYEITAMLLDCRNILKTCESATIGKTLINVKVCQLEDLIIKLERRNKVSLTQQLTSNRQ